MEFNKNMLFFCYDLALHRTLKDKGITFITSAISNKNQRFWLYWRTPEVNQTIDSYFN